MSKIPTDEIQAEHDRFMAQPPVPYRDGYEITPKSHVGEPYWLGGEFVYWGWIICRRNLNVGPGGVWFRSIEEAKHGVDCIYAAGGHDAPLGLTRWSDEFWRLMRAGA